MLGAVVWLAATLAGAETTAMVPVIPERFYPSRALVEEVEGFVRIECRVTLEGRLDRCRTLEETPEGYSFGAAAIKWAESEARLKVKPDATGEEVVAFPLRFRIRP